MDCSTPGLRLHRQLPVLKLMSVESVMPSNHLMLYHPLLLLPSIFPVSGSFQMSQFFASGGQSTGSFGFSISPSNEYSRLISFRMRWLDLLAVQGTLKTLLQHLSLKASNSLVFCLLYDPALTTICDHWEDRSLDYVDLRWQSNVSAFQHTV